MKNTILLMLAVLTGISFTAVGQKKKKDLNGQTFEIKLTLTSTDKKHAKKWAKDEISFHGNKLKAMELMHEQFADTAATITRDTTAEHTFAFEATGKNKAGDEVKWSGTVEGDDISGTATYTTAKGSWDYSFEGALKGSKSSGKSKGKKIVPEFSRKTY